MKIFFKVVKIIKHLATSIVLYCEGVISFSMLIKILTILLCCTRSFWYRFKSWLIVWFWSIFFLDFIESEKKNGKYSKSKRSNTNILVRYQIPFTNFCLLLPFFIFTNVPLFFKQENTEIEDITLRRCGKIQEYVNDNNTRTW